MGLAGRLAWVLLVPIALALVLYGYLAHRARESVLMAEASAELRDHATLVEAAVYGAADLQLLNVRLERVARADRVIGIAVFDAAGASVMVTDELEAAADELSQLARRAAALDTELEEARTLPTGPTLLRTVELSPRSGTPMVAVVVRDLRYVAQLITELDRALFLTGVVLLILTALAVVVVCRVTVGRPALALVEGVERVASGDLAASVPEEGAEELARLAGAFNVMSGSLQQARLTLEREEAARMAAERKLQHARALAAVGQVAASIAHEIGSPLNVILGRARRAAGQPDCPERVKRELGTIAEQSERISRVVSGLLAAARPPRGRGPSADAARVLADVLAFVEPECRQRRITVSTAITDGRAAMVALDADQLFQVLFNLCLNAIEAQPNGGSLAIRLRHDVRSDSLIPSLAIDVEDAGPGVPAELADRIFDPFFTTKADRGGSGLGLDIANGIAREAGGRVELCAGTGHGACFRVTLPLFIAPDSDGPVARSEEVT
jgi:signal transduction histidine kinase